jgi:hypothetical protein
VQKIVGPFGQLAEVGDGATFEKGFGFWGGEGNNAGFCYFRLGILRGGRVNQNYAGYPKGMSDIKGHSFL